MTKFFKKSKKLYSWVISGNFCPYLGKNEFSWKKRALTVFKHSNYLPWCKKSEKTNPLGPPTGQGSKKSNLELSATLFEREKVIVN